MKIDIMRAFQSMVLFGAFAALAQNSPLLAQTSTDITYTSGQTADLYEPAGAGPFPAIVYIHGGSWRSGGKRDFRRLANDLAAQGYVGFSIDYDLHPHSWPTSLEESKAAVRFVQDHAAEYHVDPKRVIVLGTSAGGELAALVGLASPPAGEPPVAAAVIFNGVFNMESKAHVITRYVGTQCIKMPSPCQAASPLLQVHAGHPDTPPFFVGHGTADHLVPYSEAVIFSNALQQAGYSVTRYSAAGGGHSYWAKKAYYAANLTAVESFLKETLRKSAS